MTNYDMTPTQSLVGESLSFGQTLEQVSQIAPLDKPVLVVGERGTGKELIAARIHYLSSRWERVFVKLNCAAISESLQESELFGHEAGAFTGATRRRSGRFERANGGSLFLDELSAASLRVQEQLLRIIEYGEYERLGGQDTLTADVRVIAATNEDLPSLAERGKFRSDLLDRLAFDIITLPPLRHRREDIPILADHFATNMTRELDRPFFAGFSEQALETLVGHHWPGNVRELKNVVERSLYRHRDWERPVRVVHLDPFASPYRPEPRQPAVGDTGQSSPTVIAEGEGGLRFPVDLKALIRDREVEIISAALELAHYNQAQAAKQLGLSYHQMRAYMRKYKLSGSATPATSS